MLAFFFIRVTMRKHCALTQQGRNADTHFAKEHRSLMQKQTCQTVHSNIVPGTTLSWFNIFYVSSFSGAFSPTLLLPPLLFTAPWVVNHPCTCFFWSMLLLSHLVSIGSETKCCVLLQYDSPSHPPRHGQPHTTPSISPCLCLATRAFSWAHLASLHAPSHVWASGLGGQRHILNALPQAD